MTVMGWEPPPCCPVSAPALPMLQAPAEISHVIPPIWPLQGSPGTQSRSTVIRPMGVRSTRHPSAYTSPPAGLRRTLSQRPRSPLGWTLCSHGASSLSSTTLHGLSALSYSWHSCPAASRRALCTQQGKFRKHPGCLVPLTNSKLRANLQVQAKH